MGQSVLISEGAYKPYFKKDHFSGGRPATAAPQIWHMRGLLRFAGIMGPLSSLFDFLTFGLLIFLFKAAPAEFRTTWFLESMATQILVIFIIRTNGRPWKDLPRPALAISSMVALFVAMVLPFTPLGRWFGFVAPPPIVLAGIGCLVVIYLLTAELVKSWTIRTRSGLPPHRPAPLRVLS